MRCNIRDWVRKTLVDNYGHQVHDFRSQLLLDPGLPIAVTVREDAKIAVNVLLPYDLPENPEVLKNLMTHNTAYKQCRYGITQITPDVTVYELSWICEYEDLINTIEGLRAEARRILVLLAMSQEGSNGADYTRDPAGKLE